MPISAYVWQKTYYPCLFLWNYPPISLYLPPAPKGFIIFIYLSFNNLGYQTFTSRLYNINYNPYYIIYKLKQICQWVTSVTVTVTAVRSFEKYVLQLYTRNQGAPIVVHHFVYICSASHLFRNLEVIELTN
jgi:hypothetical protein